FGGEHQFMSSSPAVRSHPLIEISGQIPLLSRLPVIQHQPESVALVARTQLRAIGDVLTIRRIEWSVVGGLVLGSDVLGLCSTSFEVASAGKFTGTVNKSLLVEAAGIAS